MDALKIAAESGATNGRAEGVCEYRAQHRTEDDTDDDGGERAMWNADAPILSGEQHQRAGGAGNRDQDGLPADEDGDREAGGSA